MNELLEKQSGKRKWTGIVLLSIGISVFLVAILALAMRIDGSDSSWKSFLILAGIAIALMMWGGYLLPDEPKPKTQ